MTNPKRFSRLQTGLFITLAIGLLAATPTPRAYADSLAKSFAAPPASARPWVYWFWLNGNVSKAGITADLEAMQRVGIGGVLIMSVDQGTPKGPVAFGSPQWRTLFQFVCSEAHRLGLQVNMNNDAGWCGSGGPWITPALSMQALVWSEQAVVGPKQVAMALPQPNAVDNYYQDVAVLAVPTPVDDNYRIPGVLSNAGFGAGPYPTKEFPPTPAAIDTVPATQSVAESKIIDLTAQYRDGKLTWNAPPGKWTILRFGHTSTGVENHPSPEPGLGLESDKLSREATKAQFDGLMAKLVADNGPLVGNTLVSTHIDSWETGTQDWTPKFREEFRQLRGYDPRPYLPVLSGRVVGSLDESQRFLWDMRQTTSDLLLQNYAVYMRTLAHQHGLHLSIEGYTAPTDDLTYGGVADEPMAEFWSSPMYGEADTVPLMASAAHTYGKTILGAEAFTAGADEKWQFSPKSVKAIGDWAFCEGVNRFVIHRYAMQPFLNVEPGVSMGPWGLHYERTETWWDQSKPWHEYLARCQYLLRQGQYVADVCYLEPEGAPRLFVAPPSSRTGQPQNRPGYNYDDCSPDAVLNLMSVKSGLLTLPSGMSYRAMVLPDAQTMTPKLLAKIASLVQAGANVIGAPPVRSPSLTDYPNCDAQVRKTAAALWGDCNGTTIFSHRYGKGQIVWGRDAAQTIASMGVPPDFSCSSTHGFDYIHRHMKDGTEIYFVANLGKRARALSCTFRVAGEAPEFWQPETGQMQPAPEYTQGTNTTTIPIRLEGAQAVFVVFRKNNNSDEHAVSLTRDGATLLDKPLKVAPIIEKAVYGVLTDPSKTRDVRAKLQALIDSSGSDYEFPVAAMAEGDDPAYGTVKTLKIDYTVNGRKYHAEGQDRDIIDLTDGSQDSERVARLRVKSDRHLELEAWQNGSYAVKMASGKSLTCAVTAIPKPYAIASAWMLSFPAGSDAPASVTLDKLASWSENSNAGVRYFSGTATYRTTFAPSAEILAKNQSVTLNLGDVQAIADVSLNGKELGVLWKPPYRVDVSSALQPGANTLVVRVTNLWINRMIGDEQLPEDSERNLNGTLKEWPQWLLDGRASPTGRKTFTTWRLWDKDSPLQASGLIGPVTLSVARHIPLSAN